MGIHGNLKGYRERINLKILKNKKQSKLFRIIIGLLFSLVIIINMGFFIITINAEIIQNWNKKLIINKVIEKESELLIIIDKINSQEFVSTIHRWRNEPNILSYKKIDDKDITKIFKEFSLISIINSMNDSEIKHVVFAIYPYWKYVGSDYQCGFYFSEDNEAINIYTIKYIHSDNKIYMEIPNRGKAWYRTEKIIDNWWFYELDWVNPKDD